MNIEQIYTGCLAQGAYYIESKGEVAIIDPLRETDPYVDRAIEKHHTIKYIFETHFHADFVSGHVDLANKTGAKIVFGPGAKTDYDIHEAHDGEEFEIGFNVAYFLDALGVIQSERVSIKLTDANSSCLVQGEDEPECKYVIMPMRL